MASNELPGRRANGPAFVMSPLLGHRIESIVAYACTDTDPLEADILVMRLAEVSLTHRFFLDAGIGVWEAWPPADAVADFVECRLANVGEYFDLRGRVLNEATCVGTSKHFNSHQPSHFRFEFVGGGCLSLAYRNETPPWDSATVLQFVPEASVGRR